MPKNRDPDPLPEPELPGTVLGRDGKELSAANSARPPGESPVGRPKVVKPKSGERCRACARKLRGAPRGQFGLCPKCDRELEADLATWAAGISDSLDLMVEFDAYLARRGQADRDAAA